ncbi:hypothetical protein [Alteribacter aurantiacus]|uniref:hypothetical protein n=1 Tax=Alteribacter aurantiacus TaxID=254410 RepID=UPI00040C6508|nr:hypothetical protein [Alteribacter aurantiacus]
MKKDVKGNEFGEQWNEDNGEIEAELERFLVKYPDEREIEATIHTLRQYVPEKEKGNAQQTPYSQRLVTILKRATKEVSMISPSYWVISMLLFAFGYVITSSFTENPFMMFVVLGTLPFILGVTEVVKGRDQGMMELEMSCKHSAQEVMLSRLVVIGSYNVLLNSILMIGFVPIDSRVTQWEMILVSLTALTIFASVSLAIVMRMRGITGTLTVISAWVVTLVVLGSNYPWIEKFVHGSFLIQLAVLITALCLLLLQVKHMMDRFSTVKGEEYNEFDR